MYKKKVALYPIFADTMPIVRYLKTYRKDLEIVELLSPLGCGGCGQDAGIFDNREPFGKEVIDFRLAHFDSWEYLFLVAHDAPGYSEKELVDAVYEPIIRLALEHDRKLIAARALFPEISKLTGVAGKVDCPTNYAIPEKRDFGKIYHPSQYTILVGGIIPEANTFEVFLSLLGELSKQYRVATFSSARNADICNIMDGHSILNNSTYTEVEKIYAINDAIRDQCREKHAEILLLHINEALLSFSDSSPRGFGVIPYMISQIITPDYCICCLPYGYAAPAFLSELKSGLRGKFGLDVDMWHLSNAMLDHTIQSEIRDAPTIYLPMHTVQKQIAELPEDTLDIKSLVSLSGLTAILNEIIQDHQQGALDIDSLYESR